jgi:hypothetical protein
MSRDAYLYFDKREPAGKVSDWLEVCAWTREHGPRGPALNALLEQDETVSAAEVERDLIACFQRATSWPVQVEEFLEAVLGRLFTDRLIGFEFEEPEPDDEEEEPQLPEFSWDLDCRLAARLVGHLQQTNEHDWEKVKTRACLLLWLAKRLQTASESSWDDIDDEDDDDEEQLTPNRLRMLEIRAAVLELAPTIATPRGRRSRRKKS